MKVGASKVVISPYGEMLPFPSMDGRRDDLTKCYGKIYRDIHVRTVAVESGGKTAIFMTFELASGCCTARIRKTLQEKYGIDPKYVSFSATHNHEAVFPTSLLLGGDMGGNEITDMYEEYVYAQAIKSADEAIAAMEPAKYAFGKGNSYINACRDQELLDGSWVQGRDFEGPCDKTLAVLKFVSLEGRLIAVIMNYGMHGTACYLKKDEAGETMMVAGDVPGFVSDFVEAHYAADNTVAAWTIAAGGNVNPIFFCGYLMYDADGQTGGFFNPGFDSWKMAEHLGQTQGIDAVRIIDGIKDCKLKDKMYIKVVDRIVTVPGQKRVGRGIKGNDNFVIEDGDPVDIRLKVMTLDDIAILSINGELVAEIGIRLKEALPVKDVMIFSVSEESVGYLPDKRGYNNHTFAFFGTRVKDGLTEEYITPAYLEMLNERFYVD